MRSILAFLKSSLFYDYFKVKANGAIVGKIL